MRFPHPLRSQRALRVARSMRPNTLGLPGPSLWEMAWGLRAIRSDPLTFLEQTHSRYGDLVAFPVPGAPTLLLSDPEAVRHVLQVNAPNWSKATLQYSGLASVTGPGLLAVSDDRWMARRRIAAPAFARSRIDAIGVSVVEVCRGAVHSLGDRPGQIPASGERLVDVYALSMQMTLDVIGRTLFHSDLTEVTEQLIRATDEAAELVVAQGRSLPWPKLVPTPVNRRLRRSVATLDHICRRLVTDRRARGVSERDTDLLGLLIVAGLPDDAIRDELVTMVVAGYETVASALTWTLMLLAEHPDAQQRLRAEARAAGEWTPLRLRERLPWTRAVVDESLRLFPPGWVVSRKAGGADSIGGQPVPAGTLAIISPWLLHRNARYWPDPGEFRPDRFLDAVSTQVRPDYIPFGLGPRLCIGRDLALVELTILLVELLRDHAVTLPSGWKRPELNVFATLRPRGGLRLVIRPCPGP
jgi:cytochrome P450